MALQDYHLSSSIRANPLGDDETGRDYIERLVADLRKSYRHEVMYISARGFDVRRRLAVMAVRVHPRIFRDLFRPERQERAQLQRIPDELRVSYSIKDQPGLRREIAANLGIDDKNHSQHGSNFDSPQTVKQIIDNIFATASGDLRRQAAERCLKHYGYDPS